VNDTTPNPTGAPRVLLVDPDDRIRESLAGLMGIGQHLVVVGSAGEPKAALALAEEQRPDCVVLDPRLPELDAGRAFIDRLRELRPDVCIVAMGWAEPLESCGVADQVDACVRKTFRASELVAAVLAATRARAA
jgi:CheY-like chemotaxis protein